ncbi:hypothetical protein OG539_16400 [Actinacidiphila glaucinigra]|uniref:hypothetical protein n=1 Tax=Actinacidiphila glaucinigra TaxID=235986 RepID=UPI00324C7012
MSTIVIHCSRPGCCFKRSYTVAPDGRRRRRQHCSEACARWHMEAKRAAKSSGPDADEEAKRLLALLPALDARVVPGQRIPEFPVRDASWVY